MKNGWLEGFAAHPSDPENVLAHISGLRWAGTHMVDNGGWRMEVRVGARTTEGRLLEAALFKNGEQVLVAVIGKTGRPPPALAVIRERLQLTRYMNPHGSDGDDADRWVEALEHSAHACAVQAHSDLEAIPEAPWVFLSRTEVDEYLKTLPPDPVIETPDGEGVINLAGIDERTVLYGPTKQGKSWAGQWIAQRAAEMEGGGPMLYIVTEARNQFLRRIAEFFPADLPLFITTPPPPEDRYRLAEKMNEEGMVGVVVDVIAPLMDEENTAASYNQMLRELEPLTAGRFTVLIAHTGKDETRRIRGSSRIEQEVRYIYKVAGSRSGSGPLNIRIVPEKDGGRHPATGVRLTVEGKSITAAALTKMERSFGDDWNPLDHIEEAFRIAQDAEPGWLPGKRSFHPALQGLAGLAEAEAPTRGAADKAVVMAVKMGRLEAVEKGGYKGSLGYRLPPEKLSDNWLLNP